MSRRSSLQFRLSIGFGLVMGTVCAMLIGYFAWVTRAESLAKARGILQASAHREAGRLEAQLNKAMDVARVVAQSFGALTQAPGGIAREEAHTLMRSVLEQNPDFLDLDTVWEPDAFDGSDARFAGTPGHDRTGRFIPVWNRARDGSIQWEPAQFYDSPGKGDYYLLPLRSGRECLLEPYEYPLRGEKVFMTSLVVPVLRQGRSVGIVGVGKRLSEQLAQAQKMEAIGQLAGGVAHDFNISLAGIIGAAEVLRYETGAVSKRENLLDLIIMAAERAGRLTQKLLAFSRKAPKASSPVDVLAIVKDVTEILARTLDRNIQIRVDAQAANTWVVGDDALLQNALLNLGINAGHAMPTGGVLAFRLLNRTLDGASCEALPFALEPGDFLEIEIRDTGTGMGPEVKERIFEPFFTTKEQGKGTGLGLSAVYGSVLDHHGAITVDSEPGSGTAFHIHLPLAPRDQVTRPATALAEEGTATLLFIDDDEFIRITGRAMLERLGYTVFTAEDGQAGIELFRAKKGQIDLILLDMIMPAMGGREALARIREMDPDIPIVMCSGFSKEDDLVNLGEFAIAGFLHKPFRGVELAQVVARALRRPG